MTVTVFVYEKTNLIYHLRTFISGFKYTYLLKKNSGTLRAEQEVPHHDELFQLRLRLSKLALSPDLPVAPLSSGLAHYAIAF